MSRRAALLSDIFENFALSISKTDLAIILCRCVCVFMYRVGVGVRGGGKEKAEWL